MRENEPNNKIRKNLIVPQKTQLQTEIILQILKHGVQMVHIFITGIKLADGTLIITT